MKEATFKFNGNEITFNFDEENVMVNATQMAKVFDAQVVAFLRNDSTKKFIEECLKSENSHFLNVKNEEDLVTSKQNKGTFMHRYLAIKFAMWLSPAFELWVTSMIDKIMFGELIQYKKALKEVANREKERNKLKEELRVDKRFVRLEEIERELSKATYHRGKFNREQIELFKGE